MLYSLGGFAGVWALYAAFRKVESGQAAETWAPIAVVYNLGGIWSALAKWGRFLFFGGIGVCLFSLGLSQALGRRTKRAPSTPVASKLLD